MQPPCRLRPGHWLPLPSAIVNPLSTALAFTLHPPENTPVSTIKAPPTPFPSTTSPGQRFVFQKIKTLGPRDSLESANNREKSISSGSTWSTIRQSLANLRSDASVIISGFNNRFQNSSTRPTPNVPKSGAPVFTDSAKRLSTRLKWLNGQPVRQSDQSEHLGPQLLETWADAVFPWWK